eukprot:tig00020996_g16959.t1
MTFSQSFSTGEVAGSVSDIPPCCAESHAEGKASARRVERQLDERPSLAALSFAPHRETRHLDLHAASSGSSASGLELHPARCTRQGLCTPRRAAARRAACCAEGQAGGTAARPPHAASSGNSASGLELRPAGLEARPPHAASSGNSASGLELRPARLRGKASARRVERQLGERPRASPRPASRQGLRTPLQAAARRAASSFPRPGSKQGLCTTSRAAARRAASRFTPPGFETRQLHATSSGSSANGIEPRPARLRHEPHPTPPPRSDERRAGGKASAAAGHVSLAGLGDRPRASPAGIEARPLHAASSGSSASSLELSSALLRGKASARRVERQLGERPRASPARDPQRETLEGGGKRRVISRLDLDSRRPRGGGGRNAAATHLSLAPSRQGRGARGAAAGHVSLGSSTRGALTAGRPGRSGGPSIASRPASQGAVLAADHLLLGVSTHDARAAGRPERSGGPSLAWDLDSRRPRGGGGRNAAAAHLSLGVSTHDARAAEAAGTQRRPISCLATQLAAPSRQGRGGRGAAAAHVSLGRSPRGAFAAGAAGTQRGGELAASSRRRRPDIAADHLSLRNPTRGAFATGPGRPEDSN